MPLSYTYFNNGRRNAVKASGSTILNYLYDGFGQTVAATDTAQRFYQYDQAANMVAIEFGSGAFLAANGLIYRLGYLVLIKVLQKWRMRLLK